MSPAAATAVEAIERPKTLPPPLLLQEEEEEKQEEEEEG